MPRASKIKHSNQKQKEFFKQLIFVVAKIRTEITAENFLNDLLTEEEKIMLSKRLILFAMLKKGYSHSEIKSSLELSFETIRNHSSRLASKSKDFDAILKTLLKRKEMDELFEKIDKLLKPLDLFLKSKTDMKARNKLLARDY